MRSCGPAAGAACGDGRGRVVVRCALISRWVLLPAQLLKSPPIRVLVDLTPGKLLPQNLFSGIAGRRGRPVSLAAPDQGPDDQNEHHQADKPHEHHQPASAPAHVPWAPGAPVLNREKHGIASVPRAVVGGQQAPQLIRQHPGGTIHEHAGTRISRSSHGRARRRCGATTEPDSWAWDMPQRLGARRRSTNCGDPAHPRGVVTGTTGMYRQPWRRRWTTIRGRTASARPTTR
jgi:hypothetical protein